jgi:ADP-ribosylglycohydrolase
VNLNLQDYRNKVLGCWLGKNIGGTLGAPFEWRRQVNNVSFYTQDLGGDPLPNDDLDIQLLWLVALEEKGIELDASILAEYWTLYVTPHWSEYGTAKINMRSGLMPPLCGTLHNEYKDSCGAFIRSEIWACIAPGCPQVAARYAYEDAILDHGNGEGVYGEVFCAALESAAFVESDIHKLIQVGLSYIPAECGVSGAVHCALEAHQLGKTWREARNLMLEKYRGSAMFNLRDTVSDEDWERGWGEGQRGWDVPSNIGMLLIGLLYGEGEFDRSITTAVNCGEDTDCTGATAGSILGIMHGVESIPERWIAPIGHKIRTACLNLGELGFYGNQIPATIDDLTRRTERIARQVALRFQLPLLSADHPTDLADLQVTQLLAGPLRTALYRNPNGPIYRFPFFDVAVDYGASPTVADGTPKTVRLRIDNTYKVQATLNLRWYAPEGWRVSPAEEGKLFSLPTHLGVPLVVEFALQAEKVPSITNRFVVELTSDGRPTVMLVPIILLNGSLAGA